MDREILYIKTDMGDVFEHTPFNDIRITEYSYSSVRMGIPSLSATVMFPRCLDKEWTGREYVVLRGEKYYVRDTPTSSKSNTDARFKHEINFVSERTQLGKTYFYDVVPENASDKTTITANKPCSNSTEFAFYGTIHEFVDRLNCAFLYAGIGDSILKTKTTLGNTDTPKGDGYCAMVDDFTAYDTAATKDMSFTDQYLWDAITQAYEKYEIPFEFHGKKIVFGAKDKVVDTIFKYGQSNQLLSVTKTNANAKVINRITFKGSTENIPYFYPNDSEYGDTALFWDETELGDGYYEISNKRLFYARVPQSTWVTEGHTQAPSAVLTGNKKLFLGDNTTSKAITMGEPIRLGVPSTFDNTEIKLELQASTFVSGDFYLDVLGDYWIQNESVPSFNQPSLLNDKSFIKAEVYKPKFGTQKEKVYHTISKLTYSSIKIPLDSSRNEHIRITFKVDFPDGSVRYNESYLRIDKIELRPATTAKDYVLVGDTRYNSFADIGVKKITSARNAPFYWKSVKRLAFQTTLMPPKYRNTDGGERSYNAYNEPYSEEYALAHKDAYTDPDTGKAYSFPNPYVKGHPDEYIYVNEAIKPTIEGVKNASDQLMGVIADIAFDDNDNDSLKGEIDEDDGKNNIDNYAHSFFYIKLNRFDGEYGFDLIDHASQTGPMTIQMTSGNCNGCKFKIQVAKVGEDGVQVYRNPVQVGSDGDIVSGDYDSKVNPQNIIESQQHTDKNSIWICVQKDIETFGVIIPNRSHNYLPKAGDTFNIIKIDLPKGYILAAEKRGEEEMMRFMFDNNEEKFNFSIDMSRIYLAKNTPVLAQIDEHSKLRIEYDGNIYERYITSLTINSKNNESLPEIKVELTDSVSPGQNFVQAVTERAASLVANATTMGGNLSGGSAAGSGLNTALSDMRYLNKMENDRTPYRLSSDTCVEVDHFTPGLGGGAMYKDAATGLVHLEVDVIKARLKAIFEELEVSKVSTVGGKQLVTPGGAITISFVEQLYSSATGRLEQFKCYFTNERDNDKTQCRFKAGDLAYCHVFNYDGDDGSSDIGDIVSGSKLKVGFYWRHVDEVGDGYIILSNTDKADNSATPRAGDVICQLGSHDDPKRASAIIISTVDGDSPCIKLLDNITDYSLDAKSEIEMGVDKTGAKPQPFFNCYGRSYIGPRDGSGYFKYTPKDGVEIKGKLSVESQVGDSTLQGLFDNIDGKSTVYYQAADPHPKPDNVNEITTALVEQWESWKGDLWYNLNDKTTYGWIQTGHVNQPFPHDDYGWRKLENQDALNALSAANSKSQVFTAEPKGPYKVGDLWIREWEINNISRKDLFRCIKDRTTGFDIKDWELATDYDNTKVVIDGGIVTAGTVQLAGDEKRIITGLTGNGTSDDSVRIWSGAAFEHKESAPFRVLQDGSVYGTEMHISGNSTFSGYMFTEKRVVTSSNWNDYFAENAYPDSGLTMWEADINRLGRWVDIQSAPNTSGAVDIKYIHLPSINSSALVKYTIEELDKVRQYVGNSVIIYNNSPYDIAVDTGPFSTVLEPRHVGRFTCELKIDSDGYEYIEWSYTKGKNRFTKI